MHAMINGHRAAFEDHGQQDGPAVIFVHGFPFSQAIWTPQVDAIKANYRTVTYDVRGHGQSSAGDDPFLIEFFVDDLAALLEHLSIHRPIVLCGLSMGGYIALRFAERYPKRLRALVLADTRSEADSNETKIKRAAAVRLAGKDLAAYTDQFLETTFAASTFKSQPALITQIREIILKMPAAIIQRTILALAARTDSTAMLSTLTIPVLLLGGKEDLLTPPQALEHMKSHLHQSELHVLPSAGHLSNMENASDFNTHLLNFLKRISA